MFLVMMKRPCVPAKGYTFRWGQGRLFDSERRLTVRLVSKVTVFWKQWCSSTETVTTDVICVSADKGLSIELLVVCNISTSRRGEQLL